MENLNKLKIRMIEGYSTLTGFKCYKQTVIAMLKEENIFGSNNVSKKFSVCPRDEMGCASGTGYHICIEKCNEGNVHQHAEIALINEAKRKGISLKDKTIYLLGHTYCCDNCMINMKKEGIKEVKIILEDSIKTISI